MSKLEAFSKTRLPISLSRTLGTSARSPQGGALAATLTVPCPLVGDEVLLQRCLFCDRSEELFRDPLDGSLSLCCRLPAATGF